MGTREVAENKKQKKSAGDRNMLWAACSLNPIFGDTSSMWHMG